MEGNHLREEHVFARYPPHHIVSGACLNRRMSSIPTIGLAKGGVRRIVGIK